ncbi:MAG: outer membrane lipoprotein-sorting protein [Proteobacteria bacterium]|jgi:hypothetical protein|nr:outer membrane lipoprotein-sorting protein [Pseudomonadota bacterium]
MKLNKTALATMIFGSLLFGATALAQEPTIEELLDATDDIQRGESSIGVIEMNVKTKRYERSMKMKSWAQGQEKTLIRILEPVKDAGMCTLKVDANIWNYLPKVDRTMKVPAGMMSGNWMGSHFSNDDLVKENRLSEDFTYEMTQKPADNEDGVYIITLVPKPDAAVVWGKVVVKVTPDKMPKSIQYFDEGGADGTEGELMRTMTFEDIRDFDGRQVPALMRLIPENKPGEFTEVRYVELEFDVEMDDSTFTLQSLRQ